MLMLLTLRTKYYNIIFAWLDVIWNNRSLDLITIASAIIVMLFSSVGQNKCVSLVTCSDDNIRWKFLFGSNTQDIGETLWLISKVSTPGRWVTATHSPQNIRLIHAGAGPEHNPCNENNSSSNCICRFKTEMATKRQNLWTAALTKC